VNLAPDRKRVTCARSRRGRTETIRKYAQPLRGGRFAGFACAGASASGKIAGPWMGSPSTEKCEPWQGQSQHALSRLPFGRCGEARRTHAEGPACRGCSTRGLACTGSWSYSSWRSHRPPRRAKPIRFATTARWSRCGSPAGESPSAICGRAPSWLGWACGAARSCLRASRVRTPSRALPSCSRRDAHRPDTPSRPAGVTPWGTGCCCAAPCRSGRDATWSTVRTGLPAPVSSSSMSTP
jgi:hypothetical protein